MEAGAWAHAPDSESILMLRLAVLSTTVCNQVAVCLPSRDRVAVILVDIVVVMVVAGAYYGPIPVIV